MRSTFIGGLLLCLLIHSLSWAQPKGFSQASKGEVEKRLEKAHQAINSIQSDFKQIKTMSVLSDKVVSTGLFYFKKQDKIRIEYKQPYYYLMVLNRGQMMVKDEKKSTQVTGKQAKMVQQMNQLILDCFQGTILSNPQFKSETYASNDQYWLSLLPLNGEVKNFFQSLELTIDKKTLAVTRLVMKEKDGDQTDMLFSNIQNNVNLNETLFKVR